MPHARPDTAPHRTSTPHAFRAAACLALLLTPAFGQAQNPSWNGTEFRRVLDETVTTPGTTTALPIAQVAGTDAGLYLRSSLASRGGQEQSIYHLVGAQLTTVMTTTQTVFAGVSALRYSGFLADGSLLFQPSTPTHSLPVYRWKETLETFVPSDAAGTNVMVKAGRILFTRHSAPTGRQIWSGPVEHPELILEDTDIPGLAGHIDFDGTHIAFHTGSATAGTLALWFRDEEGNRTRVVGEGETFPGSIKPVALAANVAPDNASLFVDQGYLYLVIDAGVRERRPDRTLLRWRKGNTEPLLALGQTALGIGGVPASAFTVGSVREGLVLATITLEGGATGVFSWKEGTWTRLFDQNSLFDGVKPVGFTLYRDGQWGSSLVLRLDQGTDRRPVYRFYSNAANPNPIDTAAILHLTRRDEYNGLLRIQGRTNTTYQLQQSSNLGSWTALGTIATSDHGIAEQPVPWTAEPGFFRAVE